MNWGYLSINMLNVGFMVRSWDIYVFHSYGVYVIYPFLKSRQTFAILAMAIGRVRSGSRQVEQNCFARGRGYVGINLFMKREKKYQS